MQSARTGLLGLVDLVRDARPEFARLMPEHVIEAMLKNASQSGFDVGKNAAEFAVDAGCMEETPDRPTAMLRRYLSYETWEKNKTSGEVDGSLADLLVIR